MARYLTGRNARTEQRQQQAILEAIERRFQPAIAREIARAMRAAIRGFEQTGEVPPAAQEHQERIGQIVLRMAEVALRVMARRILEAQRADSPVVERKDFAATVSKLAFRYIALEALRRRIVGISETTRQTIVDRVAQGFEAGLGQEATARLIRQVVPELSRYRSAVIARTETHSAAGYGAQGAAKETGLTLLKEWISAEDERTRESHKDLNEVAIGLDDYFDVGGFQAQFPGDPMLPPEESVNCFAPWSIISTAGLKRAMRHEYVGDLIELTFAGGAKLTVTPNHPILTDACWKAAGLFVNGDNALYCSIADVRVVPSQVDVGNAVARADKLYDAAQALSATMRARRGVVNFHGEVPAHDVNIVSFKGELRDAFKTFGAQLFGQIALADTNISQGFLLSQRMLGLRDRASTDCANSLISGSGAGLAIFRCAHSGRTAVSFADIRLVDAHISEASVDHGAPQPNLLRDAVHAVTSVEHFANAGQIACADCSPPLSSGAFEVREVVAVKRFHYQGPVYNFESDTGLLVSSGIVNHNCRCVLGYIPA